MNKITKFLLSIIASIGCFYTIIIIGKFVGDLIFKISTKLENIFGYDILEYIFMTFIIIFFAILFYKTKWYQNDRRRSKRCRI